MGAGSDDLVSVTGVAAGGACGSGALSAGFSRRNNEDSQKYYNEVIVMAPEVSL
jgi:hypothetical protein